MLQTVLDAALPPTVLLEFGFRARLYGIGECQQPLRGIRPAIQQNIFNQLEQILRDLLINGKLAGINDTHIQAGKDGVIKKRRMHRVAHHFVSTKRKRDVTDAAIDFRQRKSGFNAACRFDEADSVIVVFLDAGRNSEDIRIKNDVLRREAHFFGQDAVRPSADFHFAVGGIGLTLFVKGHHDDRSSVAPDLSGVIFKDVFPFFQADGIDDTFALNTFQSGLDHGPTRAVDHNGNARDVRLDRNQIQESRHCGFRIQKPFIHIDVDDLRAAFHLVARDTERFLILSGENEFRELRRARDIRAFADIDETQVGPEGQWLQTAQSKVRLGAGNRSGFQCAYCIGDGSDVLRRRSAAAANDVEPSVTSELTQDFRGFSGSLVVAAEGIRQPRVWMAAEVNWRDLGKFLDIGPHLFAAQSAVDAYRKKSCVRYGIPKGFNGLARKRAAAVIGNRDGSHHGYPAPCFRKTFLEGEERSLRM